VIFCNKFDKCVLLRERRAFKGTEVIDGNLECNCGGSSYNFQAWCCNASLSFCFCAAKVMPFIALFWFCQMLWCRWMADWMSILPHEGLLVSDPLANFLFAWCHFTDIYPQRNWRHPIIFWWRMASLTWLEKLGMGIEPSQRKWKSFSCMAVTISVWIFLSCNVCIVACSKSYLTCAALESEHQRIW